MHLPGDFVTSEGGVVLVGLVNVFGFRDLESICMDGCLQTSSQSRSCVRFLKLHAIETEDNVNLQEPSTNYFSWQGLYTWLNEGSKAHVRQQD